jgi:hydroxymethylbilane synthase
MLPAPGQGALALEVREADEDLTAMLLELDDPSTRGEVEAERAFLRRFGGGCATPIAALGREDGGTLTLEGLVLTPDGARSVRRTLAGHHQDADAIGAALADECLSAGAAGFIETRAG